MPSSTTADQTNTASVTSDTSDPVPGNDSASDTNTITTSADLSVTKSDGVTSVTAGAATTHTYTITVANAGPSDALGVDLADTFPAGFTRGTVTPDQGTCTGSPSFTCDLGTIVAGADVAITVDYTVPSSTTADQTNTASVTSDTSDPVPGNDSASDTNTVDRSADVADLKVATGSTTAGEVVIYTHTVSNAGPSDATDVTLTDDLPFQLNDADYCVITLPGDCDEEGDFADWTGSVDLGTIAAGTSKTVIVRATIDPSTPEDDPITNTATADSGDVDDPDTDNNTNSETITVTTSADLRVTKTDGVTSVTAGAATTHTYTITVANAGPSDAQGVDLADTFPAGFTRGTVTPDQGTCTGSPSFTCDLGTIVAGADVESPSTTRCRPRPRPTRPTRPRSRATPATRSTATTAPPTPTRSRRRPTSASPRATASRASPPVPPPPTPTRSRSPTPGPPTPGRRPHRHLPGRLHARHGHARPGHLHGQPQLHLRPGHDRRGRRRQITVDYTVPSSTTADQTNTATVTGDTSDPVTGNDSATDTNTITTSADLSVTKSDGVTSVTAGAGTTHTYTITVTNAGPSDALDVDLADTFPAGFTRGTVTPDQGTCRAAPASPAPGHDRRGRRRQFTVDNTVPSSTTADQTNTATVTPARATRSRATTAPPTRTRSRRRPT